MDGLPSAVLTFGAVIRPSRIAWKSGLQDCYHSTVLEGMKKAIFTKILFVIAVAALAGACNPNKPEMPVSASFRDARIGNSMVAQIHNNAGKTLKVLVEASSETTGRTKAAEFVIGGKEMVNFGWAEGWQFVSGEHIRIHDADYSDLKVKVP
jgi:hypothetical protein